MLNHTSAIPLKRCSKGDNCIHLQAIDGWLPLTLEFFGPRKNRPSGFMYTCRDCSRKQIYDGSLKRKDKQRVYMQQYRAENLDKLRADSRRWYYENREHAIALNTQWFNEHPDYKNRWYKRNKHRWSMYGRNWRRFNPLGARAKDIRRRAREVGASGSHTAGDIRIQYDSQRGLCWWCAKPVAGKYHVDHRIPLSRGGSNDPSNLCISCPTCNDSKGDKLPHEWNGRLL